MPRHCCNKYSATIVCGPAVFGAAMACVNKYAYNTTHEISLHPKMMQNTFTVLRAQGERHRLLEEWAAGIRMHDMHVDCRPSTNLKGSQSGRQQQRVARKLAQVRHSVTLLTV